MIIQDKIGAIIIQVGEPFKNHVRFIKKDGVAGYPDQVIEFAYANWGELKTKVDKMFLMADQLE